MGGTSTSTQQQQSTTAPWAPAQSSLTGILGQLGGLIPQTGINSTAQGALNTITQNGQNANQFTPAINQYTGSLLSGGGALNQSGNVNNAYNQYAANTSPLANNTNYNPLSTPGLSDSLNYLTNQIGTNINGQFAAAGRDGSPANSQAYGYGITGALAPILTAQYNQNVQNQQAAAGNLYNAGNTTANTLSGYQQNYLNNQLAGVNNVSNGLNAQNAGANAVFNASQQPFQTQAQNLGLLANIGIPIAGLGGQSQGTSTGTQTMSGAQQFAAIAGGLGSLGKLFSMRSLKEDIQQVGTLYDGTPIYRYRYKGQSTFLIGVMADEIEKHTPEAVETIGDYKKVDYKLATDRALRAA